MADASIDAKVKTGLPKGVKAGIGAALGYIGPAAWYGSAVTASAFLWQWYPLATMGLGALLGYKS